MEDLKKWIKNADFTQKAFAQEFEIPLRTVEDWLAGRRTPPSYITKLIIEKLKIITAAKIEEMMRKDANKLKSDINGNRPVGSWVLIEYIDKKVLDEYIDERMYLCGEMEDAINEYNREVNAPANVDNIYKVAYVLCNREEDGTLKAYYEDRNGNGYFEYYEIEL